MNGTRRAREPRTQRSGDLATKEGDKLRLAAKDDRDEALRELDRGLSTARLREVPKSVRDDLLTHVQTDVAELLRALEKRSGQLATSTAKKLAERGESEAAAMREILDAQRKRIEQHKAKIAEDEKQQRLVFDKDDRRELEEDKRAWDRRLSLLDAERESEPARIRASYTVKAKRVEPVGICYLWPVS